MYKKFKMDAFCLRQFSGEAGHLPILCEPSLIEDLCNAYEGALADGYAPFCKHVFIKNPT